MTSTDLAPIEAAVAQLRNPRFVEQVADALPEGVSADRFVRVATTTLREHPELLQVDRQSLFNAIVRCAQDGLLPDGREAAITKYGNKAGYLPMIGGIRKKAGEHGWVIRAKAVYEADMFDYSDEPPELRHVQARPGVDRGQIIAAYAVATHRDGRREQLVMFAEDIAKRRAQAQTDNVWKKWPAEMAEKTAAHALYDDLPLADSDRFPRLSRESDVEPAVLLYGPAARVEGLVPAGAGTDGSQPAGGVGAQEPSSPTSPAAGDEPLWDVDETLAEPGGLARPQGSEGVANDRLSSPGSASVSEVEADAAAMFVPLTGKYAVGGKEGPKTLAQILAVNPGWIVWALSNISEPAEYQRAVWTFARTYAREAFEQALAQREVSA